MILRFSFSHLKQVRGPVARDLESLVPDAVPMTVNSNLRAIPFSLGLDHEGVEFLLRGLGGIGDDGQKTSLSFVPQETFDVGRLKGTSIVRILAACLFAFVHMGLADHTKFSPEWFPEDRRQS